MSSGSAPVVREPVNRQPEEGMALCLSGGGYRAMVFHLGCLWRLNEAGILGKLKRISSVSGGSITAAVLGLAWDKLQFLAEGRSARFTELVVDPVRRMATHTIDESAVLEGLFLPGSISDKISRKYDELLFEGRTLQDLPVEPRFVINVTNVQSGVLVRFSRPYIRDYRVGTADHPRLPIAIAVAASSAFPPVLSPCEIDLEHYNLKLTPADGGEDLAEEPFTTKLVLSDGGVYDNLGLETIWKRYTTLLVSDGGGHYKPEMRPHHDWARHSIRVLDLIDSQVRALRARQLMQLFNDEKRTGAYWSIRQDIRKYGEAPELPCPLENTTELAATPTRLQKMDNRLQERLINWGYAICDAALRKYLEASQPAPRFPYPDVEV
jgi:NTE family protein